MIDFAAERDPPPGRGAAFAALLAQCAPAAAAGPEPVQLGLAALALLTLAATAVGGLAMARARALAGELRLGESQRSRLATALGESDRRLAEARSIAGLAPWDWDPAADRFDWSAEARATLGGGQWDAPEGLRGLLDRVHPDDRERFELAFRQLPTGGELDCVHRILRPEGEVRHLRTRARGDAGAVHGTFADLTDSYRVKAQQEARTRVMGLVAGGAPLAEILDAICTAVESIEPALACAILLVDVETRRLRVVAAPRLPGELAAAMDHREGEPEAAFRHPLGERLILTDCLSHPYWQSLDGALAESGIRGAWCEPIGDGDGHILGSLDIYSRSAGRLDPQWDARIAQGAALVALALRHERPPSLHRHVAEPTQGHRRTRRLAFYDPLTGLPNRALLKARLGKRIASPRRGQRGFALHLLDLDRFKDAVATLGQSQGESLLKAVGLRLRALVRDTDLVARLGDDELAVLQPDAGEPSDAATLAAKLVAGLAEPYMIEGREVRCGASLGVVFAEEGESDLDGLLARAGAALHQAKGAGRGGFAFHCESMTRQVQREAELVERLGRAAADGEPILRGQPRVALADWSVDGVELRLHWPQAPDSLADPEALARLAERPAPLLILGRWIPPAAAAQARRWRDLGLPFGRVSLDCPSRPQDCASLAQGLLHAARDQGLEPARLELALREGALLEGGAALGRLLAELDEAGMRLTLRGFGAGVSSLGLLRRLPIRAIRLDPELVRALPGAEAQATVGAALALAQSLGLDTQAAGVEDEAQARLLAGLGCRTAQGPWIAGPLDWAELERRLGAGSTLVPAGDQPRAAPL